MSTQAFPIINDPQVVLLRNDLLGIVKDKDLETAINESQEIWTVYDQIDKAIAEANRIVEKYSFIECMIFDKNNELLKHITPA